MDFLPERKKKLPQSMLGTSKKEIETRAYKQLNVETNYTIINDKLEIQMAPPGVAPSLALLCPLILPYPCGFHRPSS